MSRTFPALLPALPLFTALLAGASGCADPGPGSVVIPVQLGNSKTCNEVGVETLRAFLDEGEYTEETDCEDGEVRIDSVPEGRYSVTVQGLADDGAAIMDNLDADDSDRDVRVIGDGATVTTDPMRLTDAPARILISWNFGASNCANADITDFHVTAFETGGTAVMAEADMSCDLAEADDDGYRTVPDPDRDLNGKLLGEALIEATGTEVSFVFEPPGPGRAVRLDLVCDNGGCEAAP
jgi:hypothetical protein